MTTLRDFTYTEVYQVKTGERVLTYKGSYREAAKFAEDYYLKTDDSNVYVAKLN